MNYYLIMNKADDYGNCKMVVYYGKEKDIKRYAYYYKQIPKTHYEVLKKYNDNLNEICFEDYNCKNLKEYLENYC